MAIMKFAPVKATAISDGIEGYVTGMKIRHALDARKARRIQGDALSGDFSSIGDLARLDPAAYRDTANWASLNQIDQAKVMHGMAQAADTPEKWTAMQEKARALGVPMKGDYDFGERDELLQGTAQILGIADARTKAADADFQRKAALKSMGQLTFEQKMALKKAGKPVNNITVEAPNISLGKPATNQVQKDYVANVDHLARLNDIQSSFKPEYQTLPFKAGAKLSSVKAWLGRDLNAGDRKALSEFSKYKRRGLENLSRTIKDLTGAAMSIPEAQRIRATQPDPGDGMFDGDDPTTFQSKLTDAIRDIKRSIARKNYLLRQGITEKPWEKMELGEVDAVMRKRATEIYNAVKEQNPDADPLDIRAETKLQLEREFYSPPEGQ
jgi:hypothetical protein